MTSFEIQPMDFDPIALDANKCSEKLSNWPVVYVINSLGSGKNKRGTIYVGETLSFNSRMRQHLESEEKRQLQTVRVVLDDTFNKSVCLDLESHLIRYAFGDGSNAVLNRNDGIVDRNYYNRERYRESFDQIFDSLRAEGLFERAIPDIVNSELFKLSPFKALTDDQAAAVDDIMEGLSEDLANDIDLGNLIYIQGHPGTGKTVVAIYLMKLISDIAAHRDSEGKDADTRFSEFFLTGHRERFENLTIGIVVPQQALRASLKRVFSRTPGLDESMVLTAFEVGESTTLFDVLIVDEAHRLSQFAAQAHGTLTKRYKDINEQLFDGTKPRASQLDWLRAKSRHTILMIDTGQKVRPSDMNPSDFPGLPDGSMTSSYRGYRLQTQMRSEAGDEYITYIRQIFSPDPPEKSLDFAPYELGIVDSPAKLVSMIRERDDEVGLARIVAGYAWRWVSQKDKSQYDITLGEDIELQWNSVLVDWVNSKNALNEAGSIHTIQGYDLNYAGVIIGGDLRYDLEREELVVDKDNYYDAKGKANNTMAGQTTTLEDLLHYVLNIYTVLLTRGIKGTLIHVVDPGLRTYLGRYFRAIG